MNRTRLVWRSLCHHWPTHAGVALGTAIGTAVIVGAMLVGDSVAHSLRRMAMQRLGGTRLALASGDRFFRDELAAEIGAELGADAAGVLRLQGLAARPDGTARANQVVVLGVGTRFGPLAGADPLPPALQPGDVVLNERLAAQLQVAVGDDVILRVVKPGTLPRDMPLAPGDDADARLHVRVRALAPDMGYGRFSLHASQVPPYNAFVSRQWLQQRTALAGRANLALLGAGPTTAQADAAIGRIWKAADAELELLDLGERGVELRSRRVFMDPPVGEALRGEATLRVLTYFVNDLSIGERHTPYSIVAAVQGPALEAALPLEPGHDGFPVDLADDQIVINRWLADDLGATLGDELTMRYDVPGDGRRLIERTAAFRVRAIVPLAGLAADRDLMPAFPGLTDADHCRDWEPGTAIDLDRIRDKDEHYWDEHRGTPKAFVTLATGQRLWSNRFGDLTAVRLAPGRPVDAVAARLAATLEPAAFGLIFDDVGAAAARASRDTQPFHLLFLSLSFFLVLAAVMLTGLLFVFNVEQRAAEIGLLLAVGWAPRAVRSLLWMEGVLLALIGALAGLVGGLLYTRAVLAALASVWRGAVAGAAITFHARAGTVAAGSVISVAIATGAMWLTLRRLRRFAAPQLLAAGVAASGLVPPTRGRGRAGLVVAGLVALVACGVLGLWRPQSGQAAASGFFGLGALALLGGLALTHALLVRAGSSRSDRALTLHGLAWRGAGRRRGRSLATVVLLACGVFLVASIGVHRLEADDEADRRPGGTGGFLFYGESALPLLRDLNEPAARSDYNLDEGDMQGVSIVPLRRREGDDASCLNLNRAQEPRLLGVAPALLDERGAFTFVQTMGGTPRARGWRVLEHDPDPRAPVPAVADAATVRWALQLKLGDVIAYRDERGRPFEVRIAGLLAGSMLQGDLLIAEDAFLRRFPGTSGHHVFLIDGPAGRASELRRTLARALEDVGLEITPAARRLAAFNAVQNTYLSIFQALGGLGLILGSVGLGTVVLRNVLERRAELALLSAVGLTRRRVQKLVLIEHVLLVVLGVGSGVIAAVVAVLPALLAPRAEVPYLATAATVAAIAASALLWVTLATFTALRGPLLGALRSE